ncbi:SacI [Carpediemonas membranifera]|uniref:SacI n=1 Tax=Carpediemonas membranifera TaxID=201153 RepID=A0A8J6BBP4_9EUKA|nr:SacI [Carpediemonas membranifera]|eukprot:KAG9397424.1 SacI [Carpediemonas membranifera]
MRSRHCIVQLYNKSYFIISTLCWRSDTQVFSIDPSTGELLFSGKRGIDTFNNEDEALTFIREKYAMDKKGKKGIIRKIVTPAIIGYLPIADVGLLCYADDVSTAAMLPGGHSIYSVNNVQWLTIELSSPLSKSHQDMLSIEHLKAFDLNRHHFFCETADLTHPFPSSRDLSEYDHNLVWNEFLCQSFARAGVRLWPVLLMQGLVYTEDVPIGDADATLLMLSKRFSSNPGLRFHSRGLNDRHIPGNEIECELILLTKTSSASAVRFSSYFWRRGTVPLWWTQPPPKVTDGVKVPRIKIRSDEPFAGTCEYWGDYLTKYGHNVTLSGLSLLKLNISKSDKMETLLNEGYTASLQHVQKQSGLSVNLAFFDWHQITKDLDRNVAVEGLWAKFGALCDSVTTGIVTFKSNKPDARTPAFMYAPDGTTLDVRADSTQNTVQRFNCQDSLDRTNLCTFYISMQILAEQCRVLGLPLNTTPTNTQAHPNGWPMLGSTLDQVEKSLPKALLSALASGFVENGDTFSEIYTNSPAVYSSDIRGYSDKAGAARHRYLISAKRKYQNILKDGERQVSVECFTGNRLLRHFPSLVGDTEFITVSRAPGCVLKAIPPHRGEADAAVCTAFLLDPSSGMGDTPFVVSHGHDVVEVIAYLSAPCVPTHLTLTVLGPTDAQPSVMDICLGPTIDSMKVTHEGVLLPSVAPGTVLTFPLTRASPDLIFPEAPVRSDVLTRVVRLSLSSTGFTTMVLGPITVFGSVPKVTAESRANSQALTRDVLSFLRRSKQQTVNPGQRPTLDHTVPFLEATPCEDPLESTARPAPPAPRVDSPPVEKARVAPKLVQAYVDTLTKRLYNPRRCLELDPTHSTDSVNEKLALLLGSGVTATHPDPDSIWDDAESVLSMTEALRLEHERLRAGITPTDRDTVLALIHIDPATVSPNKKIPLTHEAPPAVSTKICALCGNKAKLACCARCHQPVCSSCMSRSPVPVPERGLFETRVHVCLQCKPVIDEQCHLIDEIRMLSAAESNSSDLTMKAARAIRSLLCSVRTMLPSDISKTRGLTLLSLFPEADLLHAVPTRAEAVFPPEVVLCTPDQVPVSCGWDAPPGLRVVEFCICLCSMATITGIHLIVDGRGFESQCVPSFSVFAGVDVSNLTPVGRFSLPTDTTPGSRLSLPMKPVRGQLLSVVAQLPEDCPADCCLRIGRLQVYGVAQPADVGAIHQFHDMMVLEGKSLNVSNGPAFTMKPHRFPASAVETAAEGRKVRYSFPSPVRLHGFTFIPTDAKFDGAQARTARVSVNDNPRNHGDVILPMVQSGTRLQYSLTKVGFLGDIGRSALQAVRSITMEFVDSHGGVLMGYLPAPPDVQIYVS